ncbi:MAG: PqqD family protein [Sphingomicrobium sp.]
MTAITKLRDRFTEADIDHEIVIMRLDNGEFFSLSGTAAATWRLIDGRRDRHALAAAANAEFDGSECEINADIDEFLVRLRETGLLAGG